MPIILTEQLFVRNIVTMTAMQIIVQKAAITIAILLMVMPPPSHFCSMSH